MTDEEFAEQRLVGAVLILRELRDFEAPEEYAPQVGDLGSALLVAVSKRDIDTFANLCWAMFRRGYKKGREVADGP